jgi:hypothetical protein
MKKRFGRNRKITPSIIGKTVGDVTIDPPSGFVDWVSYLEKNSEPPRPYRSWLEFRLFHGAMLMIPYEPITAKYSIVKECKYTPDGVYEHLWFEIKGRFRDRNEMEKYVHIQASHPDKEIIFVLHSKEVALPGAKRRKDGSRRTIEEFLIENGFRWTYEYLAETSIPEYIREADYERGITEKP